MSASAPHVRFADPEPNGLATMIGGLIEANLAAHPGRASLLKHATYSITAPDVGVSASIRLLPGSVTVRNGVIGRPDVRIESSSDDLLGLSSVPLRFGFPDAATPEGRAVTTKLLRRELKVRGLLAHPAKLARLNRLLTVL